MRSHSLILWYPAAAAIIILVAYFLRRGSKLWSQYMIQSAACTPTPDPGDVHGQRLGYYYTSAGAGAKRVSLAEEQALDAGWSPPNWSNRSTDIPADAQHPTAVARDGLRAHARWLDTGDCRFLDVLAQAAEWLVQRQGSAGDFRYTFPWGGMSSGWVSGLGQGVAITTLVRAHQQTGDSRYLASAYRALDFMLTPVEQGGCRGRFDDGSPIVEEYPSIPLRHPHVLNGAISAYFGLYDLARVTDDDQVRGAFDELVVSLKNNLHRYCAEPLSRYNSLENSRASLSYHRMHIMQLRGLSMITGDSEFNRVAARFEEQIEGRGRRLRILLYMLFAQDKERTIRQVLVPGVIVILVWLGWGFTGACGGHFTSNASLAVFALGGLASLAGLGLVIAQVSVAGRLFRGLLQLRPGHVLAAGVVACLLGTALPAVVFLGGM